MSDFMITELDERREYGVAVVDDDVLGYNNENGCTNTGHCCGTNQALCTNNGGSGACCS